MSQPPDPGTAPDPAAGDGRDAEPTSGSPAEPTSGAPADPSSAASEVTGVRPVDLRDYVAFSEEQATRVRVHATPELAVDLWCIEPRQATPVIHHEDARITYTVVGGRSWFVTDEGEIGLDPMGSMLVSPGVVHGIDNRAADPLIVVAVSSPPTQGEEDAPTATDGAAIRRDPDRPNPLRRLADRFFGSRD